MARRGLWTGPSLVSQILVGTLLLSLTPTSLAAPRRRPGVSHVLSHLCSLHPQGTEEAQQAPLRGWVVGDVGCGVELVDANRGAVGWAGTWLPPQLLVF